MTEHQSTPNSTLLPTFSERNAAKRRLKSNRDNSYFSNRNVKELSGVNVIYSRLC
jgi:hypothetical protein